MLCHVILFGQETLKNDTTLKHNWVTQFKTTNFWFVFVCYALFFFNSREFIDGERKLKRKLIQEREEQKLRQSAEEELRGGHEYSQAYRRPANPKLPPIRK